MGGEEEVMEGSDIQEERKRGLQGERRSRIEARGCV